MYSYDVWQSKICANTAVLTDHGNFILNEFDDFMIVMVEE